MYQRSCIFRSKTAHLALPDLELVFLDGPMNLVPKIVATSSKQVDTTAFKAWWDPTKPLTEDAQHKLLQYIGDALHANGPFDGVLGFSQGAVLASWLCSNYSRHELDWSPSLAVLVGGYTDPRDANTVFKHGITDGIHSFHAFGVNDRVVPAAKSESLAQLFESATPSLVTRHVHEQGHIVPKSPAIINALQEFIDEHDEYHATPMLYHAQQLR
ncbi:hypothetical protein THRCLA_20687 [Thraustotheca clavata]|uniref:Serine hydrolase domain-containing protein n=1 Tax=Thraustotheca clavata TaxID=74557 RepID=A0A1W0A4Q6_9STRA|nr:hypothetical protein THRCLA_20687 [Thraustotheca clavata]